jgi:hypothetical protein
LRKDKRDKTPEEEIDEYNRQIAKRIVDGIPDELLTDIGPLTIFERNSHLGVDSFGNRLSLEERRIAEKTKQHLRGELAAKYASGDFEQFDNTLANYGVGNIYVKKEIIRRTEERSG